MKKKATQSILHCLAGFLNNMILSMSNQAFLFFNSVLFGFAVGFVYDVLNVFRKVIYHYKIFIQIEDFFYWIFSALCLFFIMLQKNSGEIRFFLICGAFIGMILYFTILSRLFLNVSDRVLIFLKKVFCLVFWAVSLPFFTVFKFFKKIFYDCFFKKVFWGFKNVICKKKDTQK